MSINKKPVQIFLDIETLPAPHTVREAIVAAYAAEAAAEVAGVTVPGNLKKAETIAEWEATEKPKKVAAILAKAEAEADGAWRKTGLSGISGRVYCVSFAVNDAPVRTLALPEGPMGPEDERVLLVEFAEALNSVEGSVFAQYIGHNVQDFDLRFLFQRAALLGAPLPVGFPVNAPAYERETGRGRVFDTMTVWAGRHGRVKLEALCEAFGVMRKGEELDGEEIDGSMVGDFVFRGEGKKVQKYCEGDVERVRALMRKLEPTLAYCA